MIKEYVITLTSNITEEEKDTFIAIDLRQVATVRVSGDEDDKTVLDMKGGTSYVVHEDYEQVLKDWINATDTTFIRLVPIRD